MTTKLNKQIIALRQKRYTYSQIIKVLKCSRSTVSYALRKRTRLLTKQKNDNQPVHYKRIQNKLYTFKNPKTRKTPTPIWYLNPTPRQITKSISTKAHTFQRRMAFNYKDVHKKYGDQFPCALTGRPLKFSEPHTYEYDHIMPHSRGGDNSLSNLQILCPEANQAKGMMTDDEFKDLCKEVIIHAGYKIYKPLDT